MQRFIGLACLALGIMLLIWGHNSQQSVGSQIKETVTGSPVNKAVYFYVGGGLLCAVGLGSFAFPKRIS
ncbi:MAG TPA: DUF3185 family protein [Verrucomicrobiae bacterium]|nr:DUF3185 family protein [Verrucomicrobiae bacterium]